MVEAMDKVRWISHYLRGRDSTACLALAGVMQEARERDAAWERAVVTLLAHAYDAGRRSGLMEAGCEPAEDGTPPDITDAECWVAFSAWERAHKAVRGESRDGRHAIRDLSRPEGDQVVWGSDTAGRAEYWRRVGVARFRHALRAAADYRKNQRPQRSSRIGGEA